jgi:hypothetical protein
MKPLSVSLATALTLAACSSPASARPAETGVPNIDSHRSVVSQEPSAVPRPAPPPYVRRVDRAPAVGNSEPIENDPIRDRVDDRGRYLILASVATVLGVLLLAGSLIAGDRRRTERERLVAARAAAYRAHGLTPDRQPTGPMA